MNPISFLETLVKIESISGNEREISQFIAGYLREMDFDLLSSTKTHNVIGVKGEGRPVLLLASHMDTVQTDNPFRVVDNKIYGMGAVDCKPSLAAILYAAATYEWKPGMGTLVVAALVEEELNERGIEDYFEVGPRPDYAIFGEPTTSQNICIGCRGRVLLELLIESSTGHCACSWLYDNPVQIGISILNQINAFCFELNQNREDPTKYFEEVTPNISIFQAGEVANSIPNSCKICLDIRFPPQFMIQDFTNKIEDIIQNVKNGLNQTRSTEISYKFPDCLEACLISDNPINLSSLRQAIFQYTKQKAISVRKTGSTFMNTIIDHYKIPCLAYGAGNPKIEHTDDEFVEIQEYIDTINIYTRFFDKFHALYEQLQIKQVSLAKISPAESI